MNMISLASKKECTGCQACLYACAKSAISMEEDELGFLFPRIDSQKCISCGACQKSCPVLREGCFSGGQPDAYAIISNDDRKKSSSGGAFSVFARYVLAKGGVVFGACMDNSLRVFHTYIESVDDLDVLRGSKYVQSFIGSSYKDARNFLKQGRIVLFSGTPCQIAGLYAFLGKDRFENRLITLDLVCHGVPNQRVFDKYCEKLSSEYKKRGRVSNYLFRKLDSWSLITSVKFENEKKWRSLDGSDNLYMQMFFKGWTYRESCLSCSYANIKRPGTFTIADFWGIGRHGVPFKKNIASGVSLVLDNYGQMCKIDSEISKYCYLEKRTLSEAVSENQNLTSHVAYSCEREEAIYDMLDAHASLAEIASKYNLLHKKNLTSVCIRLVKKTIHCLGLYNIYKTINYKLGRR